MGDSFWNSSREEQLRTLWVDGLSASSIANIMGTSRNAVIGKKHRMGLGKRTIDAPGRNRKPVRRQYKAPLARVTVSAIPVPSLDATNPGILIDALTWNGGIPSNCRAILRHEQGKAFYCGEPNKKGESFCAGHCKLYFTAARAARNPVSVPAVSK